MAKPKPLPDGFIQDSTSKKVRCTICSQSGNASGDWILRKSVNDHLKTARHLAEVARLLELEAERLARDAKVASTYNQASAVPNRTIPGSLPHERPAMFNQDPDTAMDVDTEASPLFTYHQGSLADNLDMGIPGITSNPELVQQLLTEQFNLLAEEAEHHALFGNSDDGDDITVGSMSDHFRLMGFNEDTAEDTNERTNLGAENPDYAPYPNKTVMFLDILDNLPRLRISSSQLRFFLFCIKSLGVKNTPSYDAFRAQQKLLNKKCGTTTTGHTSSIGNKFYVNDIRETVGRKFSNPELAVHLHLYPEETEDGSVSEAWQASRWKEFSPEDRTPMFSTGFRQFFINEVSRLQDDRLVIARDWIIRKGQLTACCSVVSLTSAGWHISRSHEIIPATSFKYAYPELKEYLESQSWADPTSAPPAVNPLRELAQGDDLYTVYEPIWSDDVSGNRSKQYNKHMNFYGSCANLPGQLLQQEFCVDFISTSPHASTAEQFSVIRDQIKATHKDPIRCYNAATGRMCRVRIMCPALPADNPQQSEESSHIGGNGNSKCRKCHVGGNYMHAESNEGYSTYHYAGVARSADETKKELLGQIRAASHGVKKAVTDRQKDTGVKDKVAQYWIDILLQKCAEIRTKDPSRTIDDVSKELLEWLDKQPGDKINPLLDLAGLDPTQDTPVEILHTILLGIIKYVWHMLHTSWTDVDQALFGIRLQSTDIDGLSVPPIRAAYMMQYRKSLIGKHFKTLMQTMPFHVHDLVTPEQFQLVKAVGNLGAVLWVHKIDNMDEYLTDLEVLIANVLDAFGAVDPSKLITKIKLHMLPHLISDIRRFGPAIRNSTETYECYNAIFRLCSVLSNHQAPSRDISYKFGDMDRVKHFLSGGYWLEDGQLVQAGPKVRALLKTESVLQRHLGWAPVVSIAAGSTRAIAKAKTVIFPWTDTKASTTTKPLSLMAEQARLTQSEWKHSVAFTTQSKDTCKIGSWVFAQSNHPGASDQDSSSVIIGRVSEVLVAAESSGLVDVGLVTLDIFTIGESLHPEFEMPVLLRLAGSVEDEHESQTFLTLEVLFKFSAQHDCRLLKCPASALRHQRQERVETNRTENLIAHVDDKHYVVNMFALHNASLLRKALPKDLVTPRPLYPDRKARHAEVAVQLRARQKGKRANTAAKRKAKKDAEKVQQETHWDSGSEQGVESDDEIEGGDATGEGSDEQGRNKRQRQ